MRGRRGKRCDAFLNRTGVQNTVFHAATRPWSVSVNPCRTPGNLEFDMGHGNATRQTRQMHLVRDAFVRKVRRRRVEVGHGRIARLLKR